MSLKDKLIQKRLAEGLKEPEYQKLKSTYLVEVDNLVSSIRSWFVDLEKEKLAKVIGTQVQVIDQHLGEYLVPSIRIEIAGDAILIMPEGAEILGAHGRVDFYMQGKKHEAKRLLLADRHDDPKALVWIFWEPNSPLHKKALEQTKFFDIVESWVE